MSFLSELQPYYDAFKQWSLKQQVLAGVSVITILVYLFVLLPWFDNNRSRAAELEDKMALLAWMESKAPLLIGHTSGSPSVASGPLLTVLEKSLTTLSVKQKTLNETSGGNVDLDLKELGFDQLMTWLIQLDKQGIEVAKARFTPLKPGIVNAVVTVHRSSPK